MRIGIIDLGSNTFHILISSVNQDGSFTEVYRERVFVGLSEGGLGIIKDEKIELGLKTCSHFNTKIKEYNVTNYKIVGTAVLRKAKNRQDFIKPCEAIFNQSIEIIDGIREAELIYLGVKQLHLAMESSVIMDIGGGSVEYIVVKNGEKVWSHSFSIGVGVLHSMFHHHEPISQDMIFDCKNYIREKIIPFINYIKEIKVNELIGASGSFEVVKDVYDYDHNDLSYEVSISDLKALSTKIITSTYQGRLKIKGLPEERVKLIVVAMILIEVTIEILNPQKLIVSPYAIKEGLLSELSHG